MKKRLLSMLLALSLTAGLCQVPAAAVRYPVSWDPAPAPWAVEQMEDLADAGVLSQGAYDPTYTMTRGQFCYFMVNVVQREGRQSLLEQVEPMPVGYFQDVESGDGFGGRYNVYTAAAYGLTEGAWVDGRRLANCSDVLTREQGAKMMCALMDALEKFTGMAAGGAGAPVDFEDGESISPWARESVDRASALGILKGDEAGRFNPQGVLSFQEACVMLDRALCQAEVAVVEWEAVHGIQSLASQLEEDALLGMGDTMTQMYWLEKDGTASVLRIKNSYDGPSAIQVEDLDAQGRSAGVRDIPTELEFCAAFCEGENGYYLAFGQDNPGEENGKEVYRIVRYDRAWNRLGAASVTGGESYTVRPYHATTHTAMAERDGVLILHTARLRYQSSDGVNHQSNITIKVRTPDMHILSVSPPYPGNHVSHSFAQYVVFDGEEPVYADHGDAYPRGFALNWDAPTGNGKEMNFFPFSGEIGDNNTNAYPGGLGVGADHYLFAGASSPQDGNDKRTYGNVFLAVVPKEGFPNGRAEIQWLTDYPRTGEEFVSDVKLASLNNNTFVVMWQSTRQDAPAGMGEFCYAVFDGAGRQVGRTQAVENFIMPLNDPTVAGNTITWVRPETGAYSVFLNSRSRYLKRYQLKIELNGEAEETDPAGPTDFSLSKTDFTFFEPGETYTMKVRLTPEDASAQVTWRSSDPNVASVSWNGVVTAVGKGTATVTAEVKGLGTRSCTVRCQFKDWHKPTETPGPTGPEEGPATTVLPADGVTDRYCLNWGGGQWMTLEMVDGETLRLTGCMPDLPDYYNYVVLQAYGEQAEAPLVLGEEFSMEVAIDTGRFLRNYEEGDLFYVTAMVCQNHQPGKVNLAGFSFNGARVSLVPDGKGGCSLRVIGI